MKNNQNLIGKLEVNAKPSDFVVSSAIGSAIINGSLNYQKFNSGKIDKNDAIKNTIKASAQVGIGTGASIAAVGYLSQKNFLGAMLSVAVGVGSVIAIEKICENKKEENGK